MSSILFLDPSVSNYQSLIDGLNADIKLVVLDPNQDAVAQMTEALKTGVFDSVHIVSHGDAGELLLGSTPLSSATLPAYSSLLAQWSTYLSPNADILLYGCNVAQGDVGQAFVEQLKQLTGADVAASDDLTGNAALNGDWNLEYATGTIETPLAFQDGVLADYGSVLAPFTAGNLVVVQEGTGSAALSSVATAVLLQEFTTTGTPIQSIALPTADNGANQTLTNSGSAASEGALNLSVDGHYLTLVGYDAAVGTIGVASTASATVNRVVARVDATGAINTTTVIADAFNLNNIRSAVTNDGSSFWVAGAGATGLVYVPFGNTSSSTSTALSTQNSRVVEIFNGQLYLSTGSGTNTFKGVDTVGTGLPTTGTQTLTRLSGLTDTNSANSYSFFFADRDSSVAGLDTLYVADQSSGLKKFSFDGATWTAMGTIAGFLTGLTGVVSGNSVDLYATNGVGAANTLVKFTDSAAFNAALSGSFTTLATASANTAFRGVAFAPTAAVTTPSVNVSVSTATGTEAGTSVITVTATASSAVSSDQTVNLAVTGTNITANDYTLSNTTITIPSGQTTGSVTFTVVDDAIVESTETATLTISTPSSGITLGATSTQNITITDNDAGGSLSYSTSTLNEARAFDGSVGNKIIITLTGGDTFVGSNGDNLITASKATLTNAPAGLTPVLTLTSSTTAELSFTGTATNHANANDISNISLAFNNSAFLGGDATKVINATKSDLSINFADIGVDASTQTFTPNTGTSVGSSDASTAIALDANWTVVGDDEQSVLRVYPREGGAAVKEWNFGTDLGTGTNEVDIEASTRIGDTLYFIGSHSNKKDGTEQISRENLFSATVTGTGADTQFTYLGKNTALENALSTWDSTNVHGKGANYFGLTAASAVGVIPENVNGFSIEGMTASQDGTQLLLGFRAPQTDSSSHQNALIVPVTVSGLLSANGTNAPAFGTPIELDLGGRGIRSIEKAVSGGDYLILAGAAGSASAEVTNDFRLYRWDGTSTHPTELNVDLDSLLASTGGSFESIVDVLSTAQGTHVQLLQDNGDTVWSGQTQGSKDLPAAQQQFQGTWVTLGADVTDSSAPVLKSSTPADNASNAAINANLVLKFDEGMKAGAGSFVIKDANDTVVETIAANSANVSIAYNTVTINPTNDLVNSSAYYLEASSTALSDHSDNAWAGLTGNTAYNFTTTEPPQMFDIRVTEVAPWSSSSSSSPVTADWFELTNTGTTAIDITGWKIDDNSNSFASAVALTGISSIAAGESVIFIENGTTTLYNTFKSNWFGANPPSNLKIGGYTGAGVGLSATADAVNIYDADGNLQTNVTFGASPSASPFATFDNSALANNATVSTLSAVGTNGAFSVVHTTTEIGSPAAIAPVKIHDIQGSGATAALTGTQSIEGVVTRVFQGATKLNGFYVQEENADADANAATSEAIFVYDPNNKFAGAIGDKVQITGNVKEFTSTAAGNVSSLTELDISAGAVTIKATGNALPSVTNIQFPVTSVADLEHYEGMLVNISATTGNLAVTENYQLGRYGQVVLASTGASDEAGTDARLDQYTQFHSPSVSGYAAYQADLDTRKIYLDDGSSSQNLDPTIFGRGGNPLSATNTLRSGDTVSSVTGVLDERFEGYRIQSSSGVNFTADNPRPETAPDLGGTLKVASFNVLNYFNDLDAGGSITTNGLTFQPRGANTAAEFTRQSDKIVQAITKSGADVLGLMEIENNGFGANSAIQDLVNKLNASAGAGTYSFITPTTRLGTDAINVGLVYKSGAVVPVGSAATMPDGYGSGAFDVVGRKPLAQTFEEVATGERFTVVVDHLKSKGSSAGGAGDADANDGQGLSNGTRTHQAQDLATWLATNPTGTTDSDYLLLGDFNAYAKEDPIVALNTAGYGNLLPASSYSYVFDGQIGSLDHALGTSSLSAQVTGAEKWLINADEPTVLDYNTEFKTSGQVSSLYAANQFRASDHNPVLVGLDLNGAPVFDSANTGSVAENAATTTVIYTAAAHDVDSSIAPSYSLKVTGDASLLTINTSKGEVTLKNSANFEAKSSYSFTVIATDNTNFTAEKAVTVSVSNVNEAPTISSSSTGSVAENASTSTVIYTVVAGDVDANDTLTYSLKAATGDVAALSIDANTGEVTLKNAADYETKTSYSFTVIASDAGSLTAEKAIVVNVSNLDEIAPSITSTNTATAINENSGANQVVYTATSTDTADIATGTTSYSLKAVNDASAFSINSATGEVKLIANPNYEAKASYSFTVIAKDAANNASEKAVSLAVTDINETATGSVTLSSTTPHQGSALTVSNSLADPDGVSSLSYTWLVNGQNVATGNSYTPTANDLNQTIMVTASYSDSFGTESVNSTTTSPVAAPINISTDGDNGNTKAQSDTLIGFDGNDTLKGYMLDDSLSGAGGNDALWGGYGNDKLDGGAGDDLLNGESGADKLSGGVNNDTLDGGAGIDALDGGAGDDTYIVSYYEVDTIKDSGPITDSDTVIIPFQITRYTLPASIENATIAAGLNTYKNLSNYGTLNPTSDTLIGNNSNNVLIGNEGNNNLNGGLGNDTLTGGLAKDTFIFSDKLSTSNIDKIIDFNPIDDTIQLAHNTFTRLVNVAGVLNADFLKIGAMASDSNDYIIYNPNTGALSYDNDGSAKNAAMQIALIGTHLTLSNADFVVI